MTDDATARVYDPRVCTLGEGPLWHPQRQQLFWFDIIGKRLLTRSGNGEEGEWHFDEHVSAAGWVDTGTLLIASETGLFGFDLDTGGRQRVCELEAGNPLTRSNDGRADPWGGFWIGTMGKKLESEAGAIYRYYRGEVRRLYDRITIPNAICFSPDGHYAYFADTRRERIWRQALASLDGWPTGEPELFVDCARENVHPDGAVVDSQGNLWNAQWGASRVACYGVDGRLLFTIHFPAEQISCPAFGGDAFNLLYATSAAEHLSRAELQRQPEAGRTFVVSTDARGQAEHRVIL